MVFISAIVLLPISVLGFGEQKYNLNFKPHEFEGFIRQAEFNRFVISPKRWTESINVILIQQCLEQAELLTHFNHIAITQMTFLVNNLSMKKLK